MHRPLVEVTTSVSNEDRQKMHLTIRLNALNQTLFERMVSN